AGSEFAWAGDATASLVFVSGTAWARGIASDWRRGRGPRADAWVVVRRACRAGRLHSFRHAHGIVVRFDFHEIIDHLLLTRRFDALGQMPAWLRNVRSLENGQGCPKANGGWGIRVVQQIAEGFDGAGGEIAHTVAQTFAV